MRMARKRGLHIAVLDCDTPLPHAQAKYATYGGVFTALFKASAEESDCEDWSNLKISVYNVIDHDDYPNLDDIDAILIGGSKHNSFDSEPWILRLLAFTEKVLAQDRVRLIGVCFGHQIIGRALGAPVGRNPKGWEVSVLPFRLSERGKALFERDVLILQQMHTDVVLGLPHGVESLGSSSVCEVQGMYVKDRLITVQGHPEFDEEIVREIIERRREVGAFTDALYNDSIRRVGDWHDGLHVGCRFLDFLK